MSGFQEEDRVVFVQLCSEKPVKDVAEYFGVSEACVNYWKRKLGLNIRYLRRRSEFVRGVKTCPGCKIEKKLSEYAKNRNSSQGVQARCDECRNMDYKRRYEKKKRHILDVTARYGLGLRVKLIERLGGRCAVCGDDDIFHLQIDHVNDDGYKKTREWVGRDGKFKRKRVSMRETTLRYLNGTFDIGELQVLCANHNYEKMLKTRQKFCEILALTGGGE